MNDCALIKNIISNSAYSMNTQRKILCILLTSRISRRNRNIFKSLFLSGTQILVDWLKKVINNLLILSPEVPSLQYLDIFVQPFLLLFPRLANFEEIYMLHNHIGFIIYIVQHSFLIHILQLAAVLRIRITSLYPDPDPYKKMAGSN